MFYVKAPEVPHLVYSLSGEADIELLLWAECYCTGLFKGWVWYRQDGREEKAFWAGGTSWKPSGVLYEWRIGVVSVAGRCDVWERSKLILEGNHLKGFHTECCTLAAYSVYYSNGGENSQWIRSRRTRW